MSEGSESKLWKVLNSPIVIVIIALILLPGVLAGSKYLSSMFATKSLLDQIRVTAKEMENNQETGPVKLLVSNFIGQAVSGVKEAFKSASNDQNKNLIDFKDTRENILITPLKYVPTSWESKEKLIGEITNNSTVAIKNIRLNIRFYSSKGEFIDVENKWLSNIKILSPKETIGFDVLRSIGKHGGDKKLMDSRRSIDAKVLIVGFDIVKEDS